MKRILFLFLIVTGMAGQLAAQEPAASQSNDDVLPIQEQNLGLDPTRLQTLGGASLEYLNRANKEQGLSVRANGEYRFSFLDDNRRWWSVYGNMPLTKFDGGKYSDSALGLGDLNVGVKRIIPGNTRQVIFGDLTWATSKKVGLTNGHNLLNIGYGLSMPLNDTMQLAGTISYQTQMGSANWAEGDKVQMLHFKPMLIWGYSDTWVIKGAFDLGYSLADYSNGLLDAFLPKVDNKIQMTPSVTAGHFFSDDHSWMGYGSLEFPLDKFQIGHRQQYTIKAGANYFFY